MKRLILLVALTLTLSSYSAFAKGWDGAVKWDARIPATVHVLQTP